MSSHATRGSWSRRALAVAGSAVLMVGVGVVTAPAALAAGPDTSASHASAQYLSGTWNTTGATADYTGNGTETPGAAVDQSNDIASLVSTIPGLQINGAFGNEYAHAGSGGSSWAASGRVTGAGGVGAAAPANVDIDLGQLLGLPGTETFKLKLQEIASIAKLDVASVGTNDLAPNCGADWSDPNTTNCRGYGLKSGTLSIHSDTLKAATADVQALATQVDTAIGTLTTTLPAALTSALFGPMDSAFSAALLGLPPLDTRVPALGGHVYEITAASMSNTQVTVAVSGTVAATLAGIIAAPHSINGVTVDLGSGDVSVDYDVVMGSLNPGGGLNNLPPNTALFGTAVVDSITDSVSAIIDGFAAEISAAIPALLGAVNVTVTASAAPIVTVTDTKYKWKWTGFLSGHWQVDGTPNDNTYSGFGVGGTYTGTLYQVLNGGATVSLSITGWPALLDGFGLHAPSISAVTLPGLPGGISQPIIDGVVNAGAAAIKAATKTAIDGIAGQMNSASSVFGGTINVQSGDATTGYQVSALELRFGSAAPLRSGSAFKAAPRPGAVVAPGATVRLATSIVGPNRDALTCVAGMHYDPKTGTCVKDSTPGGGGPGGGGTPTTPPTTTTTTTTEPTTEVLGTSDTVSPQSPSVEVSGESGEVTTTEVVGLAETGPRQLGLIALLGLELLLGGIAVMRLTARRRRAAHHHHHA